MQRQINAACLQFEKSLQAGPPWPRLEDYLTRTEDPIRRLLLRELLILKLYYLQAAGKSVCLEDYLRRFPDYNDLIKTVFNNGSGGSGLRDPVQRLKSASGTPVQDITAPAQTLGSLGEYLLLRLIKSGGMGSLYEAQHTMLKQQVAIKVIRSDRVDSQTAARFKQEMEAVGQLKHPNLIQALYAGATNDGQLYLVLELLQGLDLHDLIHRHGTLPLADACNLVLQAARGLHHAHEKGLVHRDLKPANLFLTSDGLVKILDLGLAQVRKNEREVDQDRLTASNCYMGTPDYMAPEQIDDAKRVDCRADLYSLGCTLYHLLAGEPPFGGPTFNTRSKKFQAHAQAKPPPITERRPDLPAAVVALLNRLLAKIPDHRPCSAAEVGAVLEPFTAESNLARLLAPPVAPDQGGQEGSWPCTEPFSKTTRHTFFQTWVGVLLGVVLILTLAIGATAVLLRSSATKATPPATSPLPRPEQVLRVMADYLEQQPATRRPHLRFLTLAHLASGPQATDVDLYRTALGQWARRVDSTSSGGTDAGASVLVVDLRDWRWTPDRWRALVKAYPYGLVPLDGDRGQQELLHRIREATGEELPYLRADWFLVRAVPQLPPEARTLSDPPAVAVVAYDRPLDLGKATAELGLADPELLRTAIRTKERLRELGLAQLAEGGTVDRRVWEQVGASTSVFQQTAKELKLGTPFLGF